MFSLRFLLATTILSALSVQAAPSLNTLSSGVVRRADDSSSADQLTQQIPASCVGQCNSTLTFYNYCENGNATLCLGICSTDSLNNLYTCVNCAISYGNMTMDEYTTINMTVSTLVSTCAATGISGAPTTSLQPYNSSTATSSNTTTAAASASASAKTGAASSRVGGTQFGAAALAGVLVVVALAL